MAKKKVKEVQIQELKLADTIQQAGEIIEAPIMVVLKNFHTGEFYEISIKELSDNQIKSLMKYNQDKCCLHYDLAKKREILCELYTNEAEKRGIEIIELIK